MIQPTMSLDPKQISDLRAEFESIATANYPKQQELTIAGVRQAEIKHKLALMELQAAYPGAEIIIGNAVAEITPEHSLNTPDKTVKALAEHGKKPRQIWVDAARYRIYVVE